jgi:soluble lytic murein transglycosylase
VRRGFPTTWLLTCALLATLPGSGELQAQQAAETPSAARELRPTIHPPLPATPDAYWLVPSTGWRPASLVVRKAAGDLARAIGLINDNKAVQALPLIHESVLASTPLHRHAIYVHGLAEMALQRYADARHSCASAREGAPDGALAERALLCEADAAMAVGDAAAAAALYVSLTAPKVAADDDVLLRLARAATISGDTARATAAWERLYFEFPATEGAAAAVMVMGVASPEQMAQGTPRFDAELARAERLFAARRFPLAQDGFDRLVSQATGDTLELISLRLAECDYFQKRYARAVERTRPFLTDASRRAEAMFFSLSATRGLGGDVAFVGLVRELVVAFPSSSWAEDALNDLGSYYVVTNDDMAADEVFRELLERFPTGRYAARAGWKVGWWAFKHGRFSEAADVFEQSAINFPRSDYRPPWLYWSGRARELQGAADLAMERYRLTVVDYANSYYGRLSSSRLTALHLDVSPDLVSATRWQSPGGSATPAIPTADLIAWLIDAKLYDAALDEVVFAQRTWGRSPVLDATRAWLLNRRGDLRPGISAMRQAYPHFLAGGGETLPLELQRVIFPVDYWPLIRQHATANKLDPFLVAALVAQESTFDAEVRSAANAIGLMQIVPSTGRKLGRRLGLRRVTAKSLTVPAINVRIGTAYFASLIKKFGTVYYALGAYNAGDSRVARWRAERPGLPREEFIDDIPFPETQNYIKRILGTADDYRRLYGPGLPAPTPVARTASADSPHEGGRR